MSQNILQPYFDLVWDLGIKLFNWTFEYWLEDSKKDLNLFFKSIKLNNKLDEFPMIIKESDKGYLITIPTGLSLNDFIKYKDNMEVYLGKDIELSLKSGLLYLEFKKELPTLVKYKLPKKMNGICVPFAKSIDRDIFIDFKEEAHVLLTGATGSGKSSTLRNILTSLVCLYPNEIKLVLIDFKVVELSLFKRLKQAEKYTTEVEVAKDIIADELQECKRRYDLFDEIGVTNIYEYNAKVPKNKRLKYRFIVIEEFVMLLEDKKKMAMSMLKRLSAISRASGQFLIITGQRFDNTVIDLVLRSNVGHRLCHKMNDEANSRLILDEPGAEKLNCKGRMIYKCGSNKVECQGYYLEVDQVKKYIKPYLNKLASAESKKLKNKLKSKEIEILNNADIKVDNNFVPSSYRDNQNINIQETNNVYENKEIINDLSFLENL